MLFVFKLTDFYIWNLSIYFLKSWYKVSTNLEPSGTSALASSGHRSRGRCPPGRSRRAPGTGGDPPSTQWLKQNKSEWNHTVLMDHLLCVSVFSLVLISTCIIYLRNNFDSSFYEQKTCNQKIYDHPLIQAPEW